MKRSRSNLTWVLAGVSLGSLGCLDFEQARGSFCDEVDPERAARLCPESAAGPHSLTFTARVHGPQGGSFTATPPEVLCTPPCSSRHDFTGEPGATFTLTALPEPGVSFHWGGACKGSNPTCTLSKTTSHDVTLTFTSYNYVFVTSSGWNSSTGVRGADELCAQRARVAGLPGTYRAWLSTSTTPARARLNGASGWIRLDGLPFATSLARLHAGYTLYPVALDESRALSSRGIITGTLADGSTATGGICGDWSAEGSATLGDALSAGSSFSNSSTGGCAAAAQGEYSVYCFGVDRSLEVEFTPAKEGRLVFVSSGPIDPSAGLAGADARCQQEAQAAGLATPDRFAALLSTASVSAASRFDVSPGTPPWVRPDGVRLVEKAWDLFYASKPLLAPLNVDARGGYVDDALIALGSPSAGTGAGPGQDCNGWSSREPTVTFLGGYARNIRFTQERSGEHSCGSFPRVLCLQR